MLNKMTVSLSFFIMVLHVKRLKTKMSINACIYWFSDILVVLLKYIGCLLNSV